MARIAVFENRYGIIQQVFLGLIRRVFGYVPDPILVLSYRREVFGKHFAPLLHQALRNPKHWSIGEVEVMAAYIAKHSSCEY